MIGERVIAWGDPAPCCGCPIVPLSRVKAWDCTCRCHSSAIELDRLLANAQHPRTAPFVLDHEDPF